MLTETILFRDDEKTYYLKCLHEEDIIKRIVITVWKTTLWDLRLPPMSLNEDQDPSPMDGFARL